MASSLTAEDYAAIRASPTMLCWKRAIDLPSHLHVQQGRIPSRHDKSIQLAYSAVFPPQKKGTKLRGLILFLHGLNEHSERYFHLFEELSAIGFGVVTYDLRSHGKSHYDIEGLRAHVHQFQEFIDDTNDVLTFAKSTLVPQWAAFSSSAGGGEDIPLVIMGMSLGSLVGLTTVLSGEHTFAGIVLVAPAVSIQMTPLLYGLSLASGFLSMFLPTARLVPPKDERWICRDPLFRKDYEADKWAKREGITCRMGTETMNRMLAVQQDQRVEDEHSAFCRLPILMLMGSDDQVTSLPLAQQFYERIKNSDKQFELIDGAYHVLFEDYERARVMSALQSWLHTRF